MHERFHVSKDFLCYFYIFRDVNFHVFVLLNTDYSTKTGMLENKKTINLYVNGSGSITSVGEERANLPVIMWFLF